MVYETVEYHAGKDLLIVRNAQLPEKEEDSLLSRSGWIEIPLEEVQDILPPTPGLPKQESSWLNLRRSSSDSEGSDSASTASADTQPARKRVYKRAPIVSGLHLSCEGETDLESS